MDGAVPHAWRCTRAWRCTTCMALYYMHGAVRPTAVAADVRGTGVWRGERLSGPRLPIVQYMSRVDVARLQ